MAWFGASQHSLALCNSTFCTDYHFTFRTGMVGCYQVLRQKDDGSWVIWMLTLEHNDKETERGPQVTSSSPPKVLLVSPFHLESSLGVSLSSREPGRNGKESMETGGLGAID